MLPTPVFLGVPCDSAGKESACNVGDVGSILWVGKIPWRMERLPTLVFWPGEFCVLYSPWCPKESEVTEQLSLRFFTSLCPEIQHCQTILDDQGIRIKGLRR